MRKRARVILTLDVLRRLLHLEDDVVIEAIVQTAENVCRAEATLLLQGEGLPEECANLEGYDADLCRIVTTSEVEYVRNDEDGQDVIERRRVVSSKVERA